jgi:hypothetical protein
MADSLPIPARAAVAREPLDPTAVVLGPQPLEAAERDGHQVIAGEVLKGRHRARGRRRGVAVSGAVLSAAGAFVTLALMVNHDAAPASASPRATPSTPIPDQPGQPTESAAPDRTHGPAPVKVAPAARPAPARTAVRASSTWAGQPAAGAGELRREVLRNAEAWARAMQEANEAAGRRGQEPVERYQASGHPEGHLGWDGRLRGAPGR